MGLSIVTWEIEGICQRHWSSWTIGVFSFTSDGAHHPTLNLYQSILLCSIYLNFKYFTVKVQKAFVIIDNPSMEGSSCPWIFSDSHSRLLIPKIMVKWIFVWNCNDLDILILISGASGIYKFNYYYNIKNPGHITYIHHWNKSHCFVLGCHLPILELVWLNLSVQQSRYNSRCFAKLEEIRNSNKYFLGSV